MKIAVIIKLWVLHFEFEEIIWTAESWRGSMPDGGEYDPLLLSRDGGESSDAHQLFKLEYVAEVAGERAAVFNRVPVVREGWFYEALPKWGYTKMEEAGFLIESLKSGHVN